MTEQDNGQDRPITCRITDSALANDPKVQSYARTIEAIMNSPEMLHEVEELVINYFTTLTFDPKHKEP